MNANDDFDGPDIFREFVPYLTHRIANMMDRSIDPYLKQEKLSMEMWRVLFILSHLGDRNLVTLSHETGVKTSTLSRLVGRMAQRGLILRRRSDTDNRTVTLTILPDGQDVVDRMMPHVDAIRELVTQDFAADELPVLHTYLRRLYRTLKENGLAASD